MKTIHPVLIALALAVIPAAAAAQPAAQSGPPALQTATNVYFGALRTADRPAFFRSVADGFEAILPDGAHLGAGDYIGATIAHQLNRSTPVQSIRVSGIAANGAAAMETVDVASWDDVQNGTPLMLERNAATHVLTLAQRADGTWLVTQDRVTAASTVQ